MPKYQNDNTEFMPMSQVLRQLRRHYDHMTSLGIKDGQCILTPMTAGDAYVLWLATNKIKKLSINGEAAMDFVIDPIKLTISDMIGMLEQMRDIYNGAYRSASWEESPVVISMVSSHQGAPDEEIDVGIIGVDATYSVNTYRDPTVQIFINWSKIKVWYTLKKFKDDLDRCTAAYNRGCHNVSMKFVDDSDGSEVDPAEVRITELGLYGVPTSEWRTKSSNFASAFCQFCTKINKICEELKGDGLSESANGVFITANNDGAKNDLYSVTRVDAISTDHLKTHRPPYIHQTGGTAYPINKLDIVIHLTKVKEKGTTL